MMSRISPFCSLLLIFSLSGCGGGTSGPATPTATPTPTTPINRSCTAQTYRPNYVVNPDSDFRLLRWPVFPLRVFFVQDEQNTEARRSLAIDGFDKWGPATNNGATYRVVSQQSDANVTVRFFAYKGGPGDSLGDSQLSFFEESGTLSFARVNIGITGDNRNDEITATHEFGHALGIYGHSPNPDDLMYFEGNDTRGGELTSADANTLLTSYCGEFNKNVNTRLAPHRGALKTITIQ